MLKISLSFIFVVLAYLLFWPVAVDPVNWNAPKNKGYVGDFQENTILRQIKTIEMKGTHGPEGLALLNGEVYASMQQKMRPETMKIHVETTITMTTQTEIDVQKATRLCHQSSWLVLQEPPAPPPTWII